MPINSDTHILFFFFVSKNEFWRKSTQFYGIFKRLTNDLIEFMRILCDKIVDKVRERKKKKLRLPQPVPGV